MRFPLWRTGRKSGGPAHRTLYERVYADGPSDDDKFIGMMETPELAQQVVDAVNIVAYMERPKLGESRVRLLADPEKCLNCHNQEEKQ